VSYDVFTGYDIHEDHLGRMWFATAYGLFRFSGGALTAYTEAQGLPTRDTRLIHEDGAGTLWVGTTRGVARLDGDRFTTFGDGAPTGRITAMHNADGLLWIGTYDSGWYLWDGWRFERLTQPDGLFCDEVFRFSKTTRAISG
jgi:ligand-binding sensor domain-containing protein